MPRKRRFRANWPLWLTAGGMVAVVLGYVLGGAWLQTVLPRRPGSLNNFELAVVSRALDATIATWFFAVGASIGSFLNVVVYRLPIGRSVNGHSSCPYCRVPIRASDNIPILGWLGLRGRCRACRLPISIQYPAVELFVGLVFLLIYFGEFARNGNNLPALRHAAAEAGIMHTLVTTTSVVRTLVLLSTISTLIAAGLMVLRASRVATVLFVWAIGVQMIGAAICPEIMPISWSFPWVEPMRIPEAVRGVLSVVAGAASGVVFAATTELVMRPFRGRDEAQLALPHHDVAGVGTLATLGGLFGWQSLPFVLMASLFATIVAIATIFWLNQVLRLRQVGQPFLGSEQASRWSDPIVWAWLGLLLVRLNWASLAQALTVRVGSDFALRWGISLATAFVLAAWLTVLRRSLVVSCVQEPDVKETLA